MFAQRKSVSLQHRRQTQSRVGGAGIDMLIHNAGRFSFGGVLATDPGTYFPAVELSMATLYGGHVALANPATAPYGVAAREVLQSLGLWAALEDRAVFDRAFKHVQRCALPNGAYEYDLRPIPRLRGGESINNVKGSLGRIQVCNWARASCGDASMTPDVLKEGLEQFFEHHEFLDVARLRPIPHEAYYANAGYFYFFGHYYAALTIELLPAADRVDVHERLRPHLMKTLRENGSTSDFHATTYMTTASTAYLILALELGLQEES